MKPLTLEWINKAEGDFTIMERESRARKSPVLDAICFHAQQCGEKYFKARLQEAGVPFQKTHSLPALFALLRPVEPTWAFDEPDLKWLSASAVEVRYPGDCANKDDAKRAVKLTREIRLVIRHGMGLG
jgi:HEPN domain-containing protein